MQCYIKHAITYKSVDNHCLKTLYDSYALTKQISVANQMDFSVPTTYILVIRQAWYLLSFYPLVICNYSNTDFCNCTESTYILGI